jgi:serine/threonine protein kinase
MVCVIRSDSPGRSFLECVMPQSLILAPRAQPIAGYTLVRPLGRGRFGEVWEAQAPGNFYVALKFLRLETREATVEERALEAMRTIRHGNLLDVHFAARVADCLVIAMPLCEQSLRKRLKACLAEGRPGVPRNELLRAMEELARAVDFLNEPRYRGEDGSLVGVPHGDIKPDNFFVVGGTVRLADFGLARILTATVFSAKGSMTASYAAPEVVQRQFSKWSDQYSLAASYCELRTGHPPFEGENALQVIPAHVHTAPNLTAIPEGERKAVARALAKQPADRWPTCQAFAQALVAGASDDDRRVRPPTLGPVPPPPGGSVWLQKTVVPPPIPPTWIDTGRPTGVTNGGRTNSGQLRSGVLLALPFALFAVVSVAIIAWLLRPPALPRGIPNLPPIAAPRLVPPSSSTLKAEQQAPTRSKNAERSVTGDMMSGDPPRDRPDSGFNENGSSSGVPVGGGVVLPQ